MEAASRIGPHPLAGSADDGTHGAAPPPPLTFVCGGVTCCFSPAPRVPRVRRTEGPDEKQMANQSVASAGWQQLSAMGRPLVPPLRRGSSSPCQPLKHGLHACMVPHGASATLCPWGLASPADLASRTLAMGLVCGPLIPTYFPAARVLHRQPPQRGALCRGVRNLRPTPGPVAGGRQLQRPRRLWARPAPGLQRHAEEGVTNGPSQLRGRHERWRWCPVSRDGCVR